MKVDRNKIWLLFDKHCAYCGTELKDSTGKHMHVDHVQPIYRNSRNLDDKDLFPSCPKCNMYKSTLPIESFRIELKRTEIQLKRSTSYNLAVRFGMIEFKEWDGLFYFEKLKSK